MNSRYYLCLAWLYGEVPELADGHDLGLPKANSNVKQLPYEYNILGYRLPYRLVTIRIFEKGYFDEFLKWRLSY